MPDTAEVDTPLEPNETILTSTGKTASSKETKGAMQASITFPDLMPLVDEVEERITFLMSVYENTLRSAMYVSAAGIECGTIWTGGWRKVCSLAADSVLQASETSLDVSSDLTDRWMDLNVRSMEATAARLAETA